MCDDLWYSLGMAAFIDKARVQYSASRTLTKLLDHKRISPSRLVKAVSMCHCLIKMLESRCKSEKYKMTRRQAKKMRMILNALWKVCMNSNIVPCWLHWYIQVVVRIPFLWLMLPFLIRAWKRFTPIQTGKWKKWNKNIGLPLVIGLHHLW